MKNSNEIKIDKLKKYKIVFTVHPKHTLSSHSFIIQKLSKSGRFYKACGNKISIEITAMCKEDIKKFINELVYGLTANESDSPNALNPEISGFTFRKI